MNNAQYDRDLIFTLEEVLEYIQYGFDYCKNTQNDGLGVPIGNSLQQVMFKKDMLFFNHEIESIRNTYRSK